MNSLENLITNSIFQIVLVAILVFLGIQFYKIWLYHKIESDWESFQESALEKVDKEREFYQQRATELEEEMLAYYKGLGLPTYSKKRRLDALWERASLGDEDAYYIILELMNIDINNHSKEYSIPESN